MLQRDLSPVVLSALVLQLSIAAQSIGEPGTQLTMRTIHSGGVAGAGDWPPQGLPPLCVFDVVGNVNEQILDARLTGSVPGVLHIRDPPVPAYLIRTVLPCHRSGVYHPSALCPGIEDGVVVRAGDQLPAASSTSVCFAGSLTLSHYTHLR